MARQSPDITVEQQNYIRQVANYSNNFTTGLGNWDRVAFVNDWWYALCFWFSPCFYQGRRDALSARFESLSRKVLRDHLGANTTAGLHRLIQEGCTENGPLDRQLQNAGVTKRYERLMVLST